MSNPKRVNYEELIETMKSHISVHKRCTSIDKISIDLNLSIKHINECLKRDPEIGKLLDANRLEYKKNIKSMGQEELYSLAVLTLQEKPHVMYKTTLYGSIGGFSKRMVERLWENEIWAEELDELLRQNRARVEDGALADLCANSDIKSIVMRLKLANPAIARQLDSGDMILNGEGSKREFLNKLERKYGMLIEAKYEDVEQPELDGGVNNEE